METIEHVVFTYTGWPAKLNKSSINKILKQSTIEAASYWHDKFLPDHFTAAGAKKYGYTKRKGEGEHGRAFWRSYIGQKQKYVRHQRPLEFSGEGKKKALGAIKITARRKGSGWECKVKLPRKYNFRHPKSKINMREEITAITSAEHGKLEKIFQASVVRQIKGLSGTRTVKV